MMNTKQLVFLVLPVLAACGGAQETADTKTLPEAAPAVSWIPEGYNSVTPGLVVEDVDAAVEFYVNAFGAEPRMKIAGPDGKTMHQEIRLGSGVVMLGAAVKGKNKTPTQLGGTPVSVNYYVKDVDSVFAQAIAAGGKAIMPLENQFWGDRWGLMIDPFGHQWGLATAKVALTPDQIKAGAEVGYAPGGKKKITAIWKKAKPAASYIQPGYTEVSIALHMADNTEQLEQYKKFGGSIRNVMPMPNGKLMHAEYVVGDSAVMLSDEMPEFGTKSPKTLGGTPAFIFTYVKNVDAATKAAAAAGAKTKGPTEMFWGDRVSWVEDASGHLWMFATHVRDVSPAQMQEAVKAMSKQ